MNTGRPNIFDYATSELSQDAFICWLVSWWNHPEEEALSECAKDFLAFLHKLKNGTKTTGKDVTDVGKPDKQKSVTWNGKDGQIDVYVEATISGKRVVFIIEDKTDTFPHHDQLELYYRGIEKTMQEAGIHEIVAVYFKTGYVFPDEEDEATRANYAILRCKDWFEFLRRPGRISNEIFVSYREYIGRKYYEPQTTSVQKLMELSDLQQFKQDFVQFLFMLELRERCSHPATDKLVSERGRSGAPFAKWDFLQIPKVYGENSEIIYYRLDRRTGGWFIALRQWTSAGYDKAKKLRRLSVYRATLESMIHSMRKDIRIREGTPTPDKSGHAESEIGVWFFDEKTNTPKAILDDLSKIHARFMEEVRESSLMNPDARQISP